MKEKLGEDGFTSPATAPCHLLDSNGEPIKRPIFCKDNKIRMYCQPALNCSCPLQSKFFLTAKSPDINIIENGWAQMVRESKIEYDMPAESIAELRIRLKHLWNKVTNNNLTYIHSLYASLPSRMKAIIESEGRISKY